MKKKKKIKKVLVLGLNNVGKKILKILRNDKIKLTVVKKKISLRSLKKINPDLILSLGYRLIIPKDIFNFPAHGSFNIHKSLLPINKGANPVFWTILKNTKAGISIHKITNKVDDGPIVMQKEISYDLSYNARMLYEKLENEQVLLFLKFWKLIKASKLKFKNSDKKKSSYYRKKDFLNILKKNTNNKNILKVINFLRASTFPPFENMRLKFGKDIYNIEINVKKASKSNRIKYGLLKSYL